MDKITKALLAIIAFALCAIAFKMYSQPTLGELYALREIKDKDQHKVAKAKLLKNVPLIYVNGGVIAAGVSGSVSIDE